MMNIVPNWHPIFVHFTVTLLTLVGLMQIGLWLMGTSKLKPSLLITQKWLIGLGVLAVIATVTTGFLAYYSVNHDTPSHLAMTDHRNWAIVTGSLFLLCALLFVLKNDVLVKLAKFGFVVVTVLVMITAFKGGEVVYRHGLGVMSMPQVIGEGHAHEHADGQGHGDKSSDAMPQEKVMSESGHGHDDGGHDDSQANMPAPEEIPTAHSHADGGHGNDEAPAKPDAVPEVISEAPATHGHDNSDGHHDKKDPTMFSGQETEAGKLVVEFHAALQNGDATRVRELLDDNIVIFEGGGVERSAEQYSSHHMISDMAFLKAMDIKVLEQQIKVTGDSAVAMSRSQIKGNYKDKEIDIQSMESMVLHKDNDNWKIVHLHWSND